MSKPGVNEFYDLHKFPDEPGITILGISMPKIAGDQKPLACLEASRHIISKINKPNVGAIIAYTDGLYLYDDTQSAQELKLKHQKLLEEHKRGYKKLLERERPFIPKAFNFLTWNQLILNTANFTNRLLDLQKIFEADLRYQSYVKKDIASVNKKISMTNIGYILEETLLDYLISKGESELPNDYIDGHENWVLQMYPGKPHRALVYLHQQNFFSLDNKKSVFQDSFYDLESKKLYDFMRLDIDTFNFSK
jgi:hypothetical protein